MQLTFDLVDRFLARIGISAPPVTREGAEKLFAAWCRAVPFDNVLKRIAIARGEVLPGLTSPAFFERFLATGAGGLCWSTSNALCDLYLALGFKARRAVGAMRPEVRGLVPNHGTVILELEGQTLLADASMLGETLLPLERRATQAGTELSPLAAEPVDDSWMITFRMPQMTEQAHCRLLWLDVDEKLFRAQHESSRDKSAFNANLFARRNREGSIVVVAAGKRHLRTHTGVHSTPLQDAFAALVDDIGISNEIAALNPADTKAG